MQEKPMSEIRVYPGTIIDGGGSKVVFTLTPIIGETREEYEHRCHEVFKLAVSLVAPSSPTFEVGDTSRYRKIGEHAYEIITPGYEPEEKPGSERENHFQGFAKLLWKDISKKLSFLSFGFSPEQQASIDENIQKVIAKRAYDLVEYALENRPLIPRNTFPDNEEIMKEVPDLTEWPE